jgi:DNA-binding response OmpR family regulator
MEFPDGERKRVLLVEDQEESRELVAFALGEYRLVCAQDFDEGLRLARRGYFDLYILDNWLPDGSGVELCRLIRKFDPHTPILFYSAVAYARDIQDAMRAGAQAYLVKPVGFDEITRAAARLTVYTGKSDYEARRAELAAILEELAIRRTKNAERVGRARERLLRSEEKALRIKAEKAFLAAGGSRGDFARLWPTMFKEEVRGHRDV